MINTCRLTGTSAPRKLIELTKSKYQLYSIEAVLTRGVTQLQSSGPTVLSASLEISSGGSLPFNDTADLTLECDGDVSAVAASGVDLSATFSLVAANRVWDLTNVNMYGSGTTLTISNIAVQDSGAGHVGKLIVGNGSNTIGTPVGYRDSDDRATYVGGDSNLPVAAFSGMAVLLTGANVPAAVVFGCNYEASGSAWVARIHFVRALNDFQSEDQSACLVVAGGRHNTIGNGTLANHNYLFGTGIADLPTVACCVLNTSVFETDDAGLERIEYDGALEVIGDEFGLPVPGFIFPISIDGGPISVIQDASIQYGQTLVMTFSRNMLTIADGAINTSSFTGRQGGRSFNGLGDSYQADGSTDVSVTIDFGGSSLGTPQVSWTGEDANIVLDDQNRPAFPFTNFDFIVSPGFSNGFDSGFGG